MEGNGVAVAAVGDSPSSAFRFLGSLSDISHNSTWQSWPNHAHEQSSIFFLFSAPWLQRQYDLFGEILLLSTWKFDDNRAGELGAGFRTRLTHCRFFHQL